MSDATHGKVESMTRHRYPERCVICKDWTIPAWTVTWTDGHTEIRCGIHGGADQ